MSKMAKKEETIDETASATGSEPLARHPSLETLAAYQVGRLSKEEEEAFERHLIDCDECVGMPVFDEPEPLQEDSNVVDFEKERNWQVVRAEIRAKNAEARATEAEDVLKSFRAECESAKSERGRERRAWRNAIAATLLCAITLGTVAARNHARVHALDAEIASLLAPQVNGAVLAVLPVRSRGNASPPEAGSPQKVIADSEHFTMILPAHGNPGDLYRVSIEDAKGNEIWSADEFTSENAVTKLGLSRRFLPAGRYKIRVSPKSDAHDVVEYRIDLQYP